MASMTCHRRDPRARLGVESTQPLLPYVLVDQVVCRVRRRAGPLGRCRSGPESPDRAHGATALKFTGHRDWPQIHPRRHHRDSTSGVVLPSVAISQNSCANKLYRRYSAIQRANGVLTLIPRRASGPSPTHPLAPGRGAPDAGTLDRDRPRRSSRHQLGCDVVLSPPPSSPGRMTGRRHRPRTCQSPRRFGRRRRRLAGSGRATSATMTMPPRRWAG